MVREGGQRYIVVGVEAKFLSIALWGVLLAIEGEAFGELAEVLVDDRLVGGVPS